MKHKLWIALGLITSVAAFAQPGTWSSYGQNPGGTRYTPLHQINNNNVAQLKVAWTYRSGELQKYEGTHTAEKAAFEATPILIGRTLYFPTPSDRVIAVDAGTGAEKWVYDPMVDLKKDYSEVSARGVAFGAGRIF